MRIDAHQHFWNYTQNSAHYVWMGPDDGALKQDFLPDTLAPLLASAGYNGTIAVQAREMPIETKFLLDLAKQHSLIKGVVGWLDLCDAGIESQIAHYSADPVLKGLRMLIHDNPDPDFADRADHLAGVALSQKYGLTYDLLLKPPHIKAAMRLVDKLPNQPFVIDHIAKPEIADALPPGWRDDMAEIAKRDNVMCKLSGLSTLAPVAQLTPERLAPYLDHLLSCFGPNRLMIGSDWPVSTLGLDYQVTLSLVVRWTATLSLDEQAAILGGNCQKFYNIAE
jgi:L-fuconolactonase